MPSSYSLPVWLEQQIAALVKSGHYSSKSDVVKDALRTLFSSRKDLQVASALELFKERKISAGKAAELCGTDALGFRKLMAQHDLYFEFEATPEGMRKANQYFPRRKRKT